MPSLRYSVLGSLLTLTNGMTASESMGLARPANQSQREGEIVRRMEALLWILLQTLRDHVFQAGGNLFSSGGQLGRLRIEDRRHGLCGGLPREGAPSRDH